MIVSLKAVEVCQAHYNDGKGCAQCPIATECDSKHRQHNDQLGYEAWRSKINAAAERVEVVA